MEDNKDVDSDLYADLAKELAKGNESEEEKPQVASDQNSTDNPSDAVVDENAEFTEEEISKLTPRAQKRIRDLAEQVKTLAEKPAEESPETPKTDSKSFKDVKDFLAAVEDEPSRKLLETFYGVIQAENKATLAPIEQKNNEARFEQEFGKYEKIEGLADHKNDLLKTFLRNPTQSVKAMIGEVVTDLQLNKVKPIEGTPSTPSRGKVDTSNLSKDELYDMLDTLRD